MKQLFISVAFIFTLMLPALSHAQSKSDDPTVTKSLDIARNMIMAVSGLADDFKKYKGDFLMKDKSENAYYMIKDIDLGTDLQYVIVKPKGTTVIAAIYKNKSKDDKTVSMAFAAFTGGITTLTNGKDFTIVRDEATTNDGALKYFLKLKDTKIAAFSYDAKANEGTLLVAVQ